MNVGFVEVKRQKFRDWFQPSRIVILSVFDDERRRFNLTTLCFSMHSAYKPPSLAFAIEKRHLSHSLLMRSQIFVLAVPGRSMASQALGCGIATGREIDKASKLEISLEQGACPAHGLLSHAIANIECELSWAQEAGDHSVFNARVTRYLVPQEYRGPGLLSIGADDSGYEVLSSSGIHKLAIPLGG
jgi:flavin reductase (DIM6/NTAB) family NADH-FMN oxidoreductase RutF